MNWREAALADAASINPRFVKKYGWQPRLDDSHDDYIDLFLHLRGKKLGDHEYLLRLRYLEDWQKAGRREDFANPDKSEEVGRPFWPPLNTVNGVNPDHQPVPAICLKGVYGYHSVLHANDPMSEAPVGRFLLELQKACNQ